MLVRNGKKQLAAGVGKPQSGSEGINWPVSRFLAKGPFDPTICSLPRPTVSLCDHQDVTGCSSFPLRIRVRVRCLEPKPSAGAPFPAKSSVLNRECHQR